MGFPLPLFPSALGTRTMDGERNRALTIVKSRGAGHSNQVRELTLSNQGVTLTDVFIAQGKVLMGVARWEWEQQEQAGRRSTQVAAEHKRLHLQLGQAEAAARLQVIRTEMKARSAEIAVLADATGSASTLLRTDKAMLRKLRHADEDLRVARRPDAKKSGIAKGKAHKVAL
jgi:circadian clock protein KaiC